MTDEEKLQVEDAFLDSVSKLLKHMNLPATLAEGKHRVTASGAVHIDILIPSPRGAGTRATIQTKHGGTQDIGSPAALKRLCDQLGIS
jgi:hypothetical protein